MKRLVSLLLILCLVLSIAPIAYAAESPYRLDFSCPDSRNYKAPTGLADFINKNIVGLGVPLCIVVKINNSFKTLYLNGDLFIDQGIIVYGKPEDVPGNDFKPNDRFGNQVKTWRYLGYATKDYYYSNELFPPDSKYNTDMSTRNWFTEPWNKKNQITTRLKPEQPNWIDRYSKQDLLTMIGRILDPHKGTEENPQGNWPKLDQQPGKDWKEELLDIMVWSQPSTGIMPGSVTGWHRDSAGFMGEPTVHVTSYTDTIH